MKIKTSYEWIYNIIFIITMVILFKLFTFIMITCFVFWAYMLKEMPKLKDSIVFIIDWYSFLLILLL